MMINYLGDCRNGMAAKLSVPRDIVETFRSNEICFEVTVAPYEFHFLLVDFAKLEFRIHC